MFELSNLFVFLMIIGQFYAAYLSYKIYSFNRMRKVFLGVTVALFLMGLRRITALLIEFKLFSQLSGWIATFDRVILPFIITVLFVLGLYEMKKEFESFEIISKKAKKILRKK